MYDINYNRLVDWFLPISKRLPKRRTWLRSLVSPINWLKGQFDTYRTATDYKLKITGQVVYMQRMLNDNFDYTLRRITVTDIPRNTAEVIYTRAEFDALGEDEKIYVYRRSEWAGLTEGEKLYIYRRLETSQQGGFVVNVPFSLTNPEYYRMASLIEYYKLAGKKYIIDDN